MFPITRIPRNRYRRLWTVVQLKQESCFWHQHFGDLPTTQWVSCVHGRLRNHHIYLTLKSSVAVHEFRHRKPPRHRLLGRKIYNLIDVNLGLPQKTILSNRRMEPCKGTPSHKLAKSMHNVPMRIAIIPATT